MNSTQENAIRFNLESARDRAQHEADRMRLMLAELVLLWEQGSIASTRSISHPVLAVPDIFRIGFRAERRGASVS